MNRYVFGYTVAASLTLLAQSTAAAAGDPTTIWDNVVCLNLITFLLAVLLPARDFSEMLVSAVSSNPLGASKHNSPDDD